MGPHSHPVVLRERDRASHRDGVSAMESAADVRRSDEGHDLLVVAHLEIPEALPHIAVDVYLPHCRAREKEPAFLFMLPEEPVLLVVILASLISPDRTISTDEVRAD